MAAALDALASYIQNMLAEMVTEEVRTLLGVSSEIDKMGVKLGDLKTFLADADRRNITDQTVKLWVRELRDAMYDATDILDLCQLKAMEQGPRCDAGCFNPLLFCMRNPHHAHDIGNRLKNLNRRLEEIKKRSSDLDFIDLDPYVDNTRVPSSGPRSHETSGEIDESSLVGEKIEEDTRNLVEMLTSDEGTNHQDNKIMIFAVVGVGGIGKTTLAQKIFNHNIIQQVFKKTIWLSVNQDFNEIGLLRNVITEAGGNHEFAGNTRSALERSLKLTLNGYKTLLVMDDVWSHHAWESVLKTPLSNALGQGSRVLITTRHVTVARGVKAEEPYHHVDKLAMEDAWSLLKMQVLRNKNDEEQVDMLKDIGMRIIAKCDGLPLAIKIIGGLLCQKNTRCTEWENVLNDSIWSLSQAQEELSNAVYLSYEDLHPNLKPCFLHYALLPKSTVFYVHDIVGMWISEGFVHGDSCDLEELGREYYTELILRNLIEPDIRHCDQRVCHMHDVVCAFAQYVTKDEALVLHKSGINIPGKFSTQKYIRLSLETEGSEENELMWSSLQAQASLRTLILVGHIKINPGDSLVIFSSLRTLHIAYAKFNTLAESLYQLKHLRYLSIENTDTSRLPRNIGKLKFLQHIGLRGCEGLVKLPGSITELQQLRFLDLTDTSINDIPRGFACLTNLKKLYGFPAHMDGAWCSLEELGPLSQLTRLHICGLENVSSSLFATKARLGEKVRLSYLFLSCATQRGDAIPEKQQQEINEIFDELCPPPRIEILVFDGYFGRLLPRWMMLREMAPLVNLRILTIEDLPYCVELPDGLSQLQCLEFLQIDHAPAIKRVGLEFVQPCHHYHNHCKILAAFPRLRELLMLEFEEWEEWEWEENVQGMPVLEVLRLSRCKLRHIPSGLALHLRNLKTLSLYDVRHLRSLENFASVVHLDLISITNLDRIGNLPKLQKLNIIDCPQIKVLDGLPALQRLELTDYNMETLPGYLQDVNPRNLLIQCSLSLLTSIADWKSSSEWVKFNHIQQVKAYADDDDNGISRKWYVIYTRDPSTFGTNITHGAIAQAQHRPQDVCLDENVFH